jgi:hypothetical protein
MALLCLGRDTQLFLRGVDRDLAGRPGTWVLRGRPGFVVYF